MNRQRGEISLKLLFLLLFVTCIACPPSQALVVTGPAASTSLKAPSLVIVGLGFTGSHLARRLNASKPPFFNQLVSTTRSGKVDPAHGDNFGGATLAYDFNAPPSSDVLQALKSCTHVLITSPPPDLPKTMPVIPLLAECENLVSVTFIGTTSVYGDHDGRWVNETTPPNRTPSLSRASRNCLATEDALARLQREKPSVAVNIFRCAGIYGDGRSAVTTLQHRIKESGAKLIPDDVNGPTIKDGEIKYTSRIHVEDIALALETKMKMDWRARGDAERSDEVFLLNLADDEPSRRTDAFEFAAELLGVRPEEGTKLAKSFTGRANSNKRIENAKLRSLIDLQFPNYKKGLTNIVEKMETF
jgi:nucleoside-diphosphate-sugar epimerase